MTIDRTQQHLYELNTESRLTRLESTNEMIFKTLVDINQQIKNTTDDINKRLKETTDEIKSSIHKLDNRINTLDNRLWAIVLLIIGSFLGKVFHWF